MEHTRSDYNRIQDPSGKIPMDEPVFLLRGQDVSAPGAVDKWAELNLLRGGNPELSRLAFDQADKMREWQKSKAKKLADRPTGI